MIKNAGNRLLSFCQTRVGDRVALRRVLGVLWRDIKKPVPPHVNWLFTLGTSALFLFMLQFATGILLLLHYQATPESAYDSVVFIREQVPFGWLIQQVHAWGANLIIVLLLLHMLRVFWYGAYKFPRELLWCAGAVALLIALAFCFTGYLLPWTQLSYWGSTVATEAPGGLPWIGPFLRAFLRGGETVGRSTLSRFFTGHVVLLPLMLGVTIPIHLFLVRFLGISPTCTVTEEKRDGYGRYLEGGRSFFPHQVLKELLACYLVLGVLLTLVLLFPFPAGQRANPLWTPEGVKPEWYFLPIYQFLKYVPEWFGFLAIHAALLCFILLPFLDRTPARQARHRPCAIAMAAILMAGMFFLGLLGHVSGNDYMIFGRHWGFDIRGKPYRVVEKTVSQTDEKTTHEHR